MTIITLDSKNSIQILIHYVEVAHKNGVFILAESDLLKRCKDVLLTGASDPEVNETVAKQILIQAVHKGQTKGSYTLEEASTLHKVVNWLSGKGVTETVQVHQTENEINSGVKREETVEQTEDEDDEDLDMLSDPVPINPVYI